MKMRKVLFACVAVALMLVAGCEQAKTIRPKQTRQRSKGTATQSSDDTGKIAAAYKDRRGDIQVRATGTVTKVLPDDTKGSRHQRFILRLSNKQTVLVVHNIDLAPRVAGLKAGDTVEFYGEYEWNDKGGVVHWTHRDPNKKHVDGWLMHRGKSYW